MRMRECVRARMRMNALKRGDGPEGLTGRAMTMTMETGRRVRYGGRDEESGTTSTFESVRRVEEEIARLRTINEEMEARLREDDARARGASGESGESGGGSGGGYVYRDAREHTLQRHREVLREYVAEHGRLRRDAEEALDRERLLGGARGGQEGSSEESMEARLIRERARTACIIHSFCYTLPACFLHARDSMRRSSQNRVRTSRSTFVFPEMASHDVISGDKLPNSQLDTGHKGLMPGVN